MKECITLICLLLFGVVLKAQDGRQAVSFERDQEQKKVVVRIGGESFTTFLYSDEIEKPVLYPLVAAGGHVLTRGFPLEIDGAERRDHPHHIGLWFNYESVNGLDFWNNSYNIAPEKKAKYGWIRNVKVTQVRDGKKEGKLSYTANWEKIDRTALLKEQTTFIFSGNAGRRVIERVTVLTALQDTVFFKDVKDGMLGIRVTKELELPSDKEEAYVDKNGVVTKMSPTKNGANGNYLTSEGKTGNEAWGTRGRWCMLFGIKDQDQVAISVIDHPQNPGYPTYWHARGYGLFAANPLGKAIFSKGKERMSLKLSPGESVSFRFQVVLTNKEWPKAEQLNEWADDFAKK